MACLNTVNYFQVSADVLQPIPRVLAVPSVHLPARRPLQAQVARTKKRDGYHHRRLSLVDVER